MLVLPYQIVMSSSGPLALAVGYGVSVLMSTAFRRSFSDAPGLFDLTPNALNTQVGRFYDDPQF